MFSKQTPLLQPKPAHLLQADDDAKGQALVKQAADLLDVCEYEAAYAALKQALLQHGAAEALVYIGEMHEKGFKYPHDMQLAVDYYKLAAKLQVPSATRHLGLLALEGKKVSRTNNDPKRFLDIAHNKGDQALIRELLLRGMAQYQKEQTTTPIGEE